MPEYNKGSLGSGILSVDSQYPHVLGYIYACLSRPRVLSTLVFLHIRINLSPFTKDFRGGEQFNESIDQFFVALPSGVAPNAEHKKRTDRVALFVQTRSLMDVMQSFSAFALT